jgi:hypothetical protein
MVLSYDRALSRTCIPEYKLIFKKKKKKNTSRALTPANASYVLRLLAMHSNAIADTITEY